MKLTRKERWWTARSGSVGRILLHICVFNILLLVNFSNEVLVYVLCIYFHAFYAHTVPMALGGVKLLLKVCAR